MTNLLPESSKDLDKRPIRLEGFALRADSAVVVGKPTVEQVEHALKFSSMMQAASGYWIGDILSYVETRSDLKDRLDEIMEVTGLARQTLYNKLYVARHVDEETRKASPSEGHSAQVAALPRPSQKKLLSRAKTEGWTVRELRQHVKAETRPAIVEGQAKLQGKYRIILADPPWPYRESNPHLDGSHTKAAQVYPQMTLEEICQLPVSAHSERNALLALWVPVPLLPMAFPVLEAWKFKYKTNRVWDKVLGNPGHYGMQVNHEHLIIGVRGSCPPEVPTPHDDSVHVERRSPVHSEKPESMRRDYLMKHWTQGPYLELFGRQPVEGWTVFGNDARLWQ